jgi:hypothetical protein
MKDLRTPASPARSRINAEERTECRNCRAHVRIQYRNAYTAAAWCSTCCTTSVYDMGEVLEAA